MIDIKLPFSIGEIVFIIKKDKDAAVPFNVSIVAIKVERIDVLILKDQFRRVVVNQEHNQDDLSVTVEDSLKKVREIFEELYEAREKEDD